MRPPHEWSRLDWLSAFGGLAAVDVATLAVWAWASEDSRVLAAFMACWVGAAIVGGLLLSETARVIQRPTGVHEA
jgi:hypothetical protein